MINDLKMNVLIKKEIFKQVISWLDRHPKIIAEIMIENKTGFIF